jgi:hypothetical protein
MKYCFECNDLLYHYGSFCDTNCLIKHAERLKRAAYYNGEIKYPEYLEAMEKILRDHYEARLEKISFLRLGRMFFS